MQGCVNLAIEHSCSVIPIFGDFFWDLRAGHLEDVGDKQPQCPDTLSCGRRKILGSKPPQTSSVPKKLCSNHSPGISQHPWSIPTPSKSSGSAPELPEELRGLFWVRDGSPRCFPDAAERNHQALAAAEGKGINSAIRDRPRSRPPKFPPAALRGHR